MQNIEKLLRSLFLLTEGVLICQPKNTPSGNLPPLVYYFSVAKETQDSFKMSEWYTWHQLALSQLANCNSIIHMQDEEKKIPEPILKASRQLQQRSPAVWELCSAKTANILSNIFFFFPFQLGHRMSLLAVFRASQQYLNSETWRDCISDHHLWDRRCAG